MSLAANTIDSACYYQKPGVADVPVSRHRRRCLTAMVQISVANSGLTIQNYNGEVAAVSGAVPLNPQWSKFTLPRSGTNAYVADVSMAGLGEFTGFQMNGARVNRARFPNGNLELPERTQPDSGNRDGILLMPGSQAVWVPPDHSRTQRSFRLCSSNAIASSALHSGWVTYLLICDLTPGFHLWAAPFSRKLRTLTPHRCATAQGWMANQCTPATWAGSVVHAPSTTCRSRTGARLAASVVARTLPRYAVG